MGGIVIPKPLFRRRQAVPLTSRPLQAMLTIVLLVAEKQSAWFTGYDLLANCPQAASISLPRDLRTVTIMPFRSKVSTYIAMVFSLAC